MCSVRKHEKWLLIENGDGTKEVVNIKRVINSAAAELAIGSVVTLAGVDDENSKTGTIVAAARDSHSLERLIESPKSNSREQSEPVNQPDLDPEAEEEGEDFSSTASSWEPSGDSSSSDASEEDEEDEEEEKPNMRVRQYFNKSSSKVLVPCHRVNAIIPNVVPPKTIQNNVGTMPAKRRKRTFSDTKEIVATEATRDILNCNGINQISNYIINPAVTDAEILNEIAGIDKCFKDIFRMLNEWKSHKIVSSWHRVVERYQPNSPGLGADAPMEIDVISTPQTSIPRPRKSVPLPQTRVRAPQSCVPSPLSKTASPNHVNHSIVNETADSDAEGYRSDESNRSDDNILITNKYSTIAQKSPTPPVNNEAKVENKKKEKGEWIPIGSGQTLIHKNQYRKVNWKSYTVATRTLLLAVFPRKTLATHSLTGKKSPAFQNLPPKMCLDQRIVQDVIMEIQDRFHIKENLIRTIITTKCADESKMMKVQQQKRKSLSGVPKKLAAIKTEELANQTC